MSDKFLIGHTSTNSPVHLYPSRLRSHMAIVGASGSGKSGLILGITEDLLTRNIPVVLVDIKGDMGNILLRKESDGFLDKIEARFLTPGASFGEPVNVFYNLDAAEKVSTAVSALLKMVGENPDPLKSKAHTYLSTILRRRQADSEPTTLLEVVHLIQNPGFSYLGSLDLEDAFPSKSRMALAIKINNLIAAPSFNAWRQGIDLSFSSLIEGRNKTPLIIYSVAHLANPDEQIFALAMLLEEMLQWTKGQSGTEELRAALVIDECVGLMPPHPSNPPTKAPLLTLLKQGRGFGVGCILSSQNAVDLDYKAMGNCQTWAVGRLRMDRDRQRLIKGVTSSIGADGRAMDAKIAGLQNRQFTIVTGDRTAIISTRDVGCNLVGPLIPEQVEDLFAQGLLDPGDVVAKLQQQLFVARKQYVYDSSEATANEVARLEHELSKLTTGNNVVPLRRDVG